MKTAIRHCYTPVGMFGGVCALSHVRLFVTPWTVAHQALCPWNSPAKILEWVAILFSKGSP